MAIVVVAVEVMVMVAVVVVIKLAAMAVVVKSCPGLVNTSWEPGPINTNWGPAGRWIQFGCQGQGWEPSKRVGAGKYKDPWNFVKFYRDLYSDFDAFVRHKNELHLSVSLLRFVFCLGRVEYAFLQVVVLYWTL